MNRLAFEIGAQFLSNDTFPRQPSVVGPFVSTLARNAIVIAGIIMIAMIIYGGFQMINGAGRDPQNMVKARQIITTGLIGFIVVFAAYWLVQIVEALTGVEIF